VLDRMTPAKPPTTRPDMPERNQHCVDVDHVKRKEVMHQSCHPNHSETINNLEFKGLALILLIVQIDR
jgi:hypothetical protein